MRLTFPDRRPLRYPAREERLWQMGGNSQIGYAEDTDKSISNPDTIIDSSHGGIYWKHDIRDGTERQRFLPERY